MRSLNTKLFFVLSFALLLAAFGCDEDPMRRGAVALSAGNADEAESAFENALKADPDNLEAKRLMADVQILREDFKKAEETLDGLWQAENFANEEAELSLEAKATKQLMERQYRELYRKWAESLDPAEKADEFERVVARGLEFDPKSTRLNTLAVQHYMASAKRLVDEGKKAEAAEAYEKVLDFRATKTQREEAEKKATELRLEAYGETFDARFAEVKPTLVENEMWDEENGVVVVTIEADVERGLRGNDPADIKKAQQQAAKPFALTMRDMVISVAGLEADADFTNAGIPKNNLAESNLRRGKLELVAHVTPDAIKETAFLVVEAEREAAAQEETEEEANPSEAEESDADAGATSDSDATAE